MAYGIKSCERNRIQTDVNWKLQQVIFLLIVLQSNLPCWRVAGKNTKNLYVLVEELAIEPGGVIKLCIT